MQYAGGGILYATWKFSTPAFTTMNAATALERYRICSIGKAMWTKGGLLV